MKKKVDFYSKENPEGVGVPYASCEYELTDEKCNDCKHADTNDTYCVNCKYRFDQGTMARLKAKDCFKPKEEKECMKCIYSNLSEFELPCCECKYNTYDIDTNYKKTKDCFKPNEKGHSSNCTISVKECNKDFTNEDYGFEEISNDEIGMVNHPPHYVGHGIEPIEFIESHNLNFCLGSVVKYIARAPYKGNELEDLKKAKWYLEREIKKHDK